MLGLLFHVHIKVIIDLYGILVEGFLVQSDIELQMIGILLMYLLSIIASEIGG